MHALLTLLLQRCCHFAIDVPVLRRCVVVAPKSVDLGLPNGPKSTLGRPKTTLGGPKIEPSSLQERPRVPQSAQECPQSVHERPKSAPRAPQERPKSAQESPKTAPRAPKSPPKSAPRAHLTALGNCFETSKVERSAFRKRSVARLAHEACREGFFIDFALVRASVGPHFDSPIPSRNEGRALVERFDSLERRITAEAPKSTLPSPQNRSKIDRERSSDDSERLQSRSWLDRGPLDALPESMLGRSSGPEAILARSGTPRSAPLVRAAPSACWLMRY